MGVMVAGGFMVLEDKRLCNLECFEQGGLSEAVDHLPPPTEVSASSGQDFFSLPSQPLEFEWMQIQLSIPYSLASALIPIGLAAHLLAVRPVPF